MRLGSLCTGYGGLDLAAEAVLGPLRHTWHAEIDAHASQVLAHHWPTTPNLGDLTAIDWHTLPRVDVLTAGFPCTDVSAAGKRAGLKPGTRTGIWSHIAYSIGVLRPALVLLENVEGLLSARAHSDVEPCPWCLGDIDPDLVVRALGAVLADLAALGFDAEWATVPASDVGAPHRRKRVFIAAWPAAHPPRFGHGHAGPAGVGGLPAATVAGGAGADGLTLLPTPAARLGDRWGTPNAETAHRRMYDEGRRNLEDAVALMPTPTVADSRGTRNATATRSAVKPTTHADGWTLSDVAYADRWGNYGPAIARWEAITGRTAPDATETGTRGQQRLAPAFVEWLMGLPAGWVTDHLPRNAALKCLGNGVVPQQAAHAYTELLAVVS